ncbi:hypothetical protein [Ensifer sp. ENS07]|uniref:hypothetical protein n=1 Tax=Ensifer sp. ENS07 TaxID=2769274 RepID=UPI001FED4891|nr:hypothetical protein [Ensifer sp. ENS07]
MMKVEDGTKTKNSDSAMIGASADLPHDRVTVERFRETFPRARWSDRLKAWFVPGRTAERRINRWLAKIEAEHDHFADEKGRDAFAFEPIDSPYLLAGPLALEIRTPYSKSVINDIREIPFARWDPDRRLWTVPYRALSELRQRWRAIESAAKHSEPQARKERMAGLKGTREEKASRARASERRRKRYPTPVDDMPPFESAISTHWGVVFFTSSDGEFADVQTMNAFYFPAKDADGYIWAMWRPGSMEELITTWPAKEPPIAAELKRGWWFPTIEELRVARRAARSKLNAYTRKSEKSNAGG